MIRNALPPLTAVARRISAPPACARLASTISAADEPSSSTAPVPPPRNVYVRTERRGPKENTKWKPRATGDVARTRRLLQPYELSDRLNKLCDEGKLDEAVETLMNMPLDAQNAAVWSNLVKHAGRANRFQYAYQLFTDMKRRGFKPTLRSFATIMGVFLKVPSWKDRTKLLQNAHKTYESYLEYMSTVKSHNPNSPELNVSPTNAYITILSNAGQWQRIFDIYNALDDEGPLSPDVITYTALFHAFAARSRQDTSQANRERMASDARLVWRQLLKRLENGADIPIDAILIDAVLQVLAMGRPADQLVAFDILRDFVGLAKPGETAPPPSVVLSGGLLSDVLWLCNTAKKYRLTVHFVQQLMDKDPDVLDRGHMDHVLTAYGALAAMGSLTESARALHTLEWMLEQEYAGDKDHRIRPGLSTYTLVLVACWRAKDWESTLRTFEIMSGYVAASFADGAAEPAKQVRRSPGRRIEPDVGAMSCIVRTAAVSGDPAAMRQCLRIVHHFGLKNFLLAESADRWGKDKRRAAPRFEDTLFYARKTAVALVEIVDALVPKKMDDRASLSGEERDWATFRSEAKKFLSIQRHHRSRETPLLEEQPLGSEEGLSATDDAVQWERISREQKYS